MGEICLSETVMESENPHDLLMRVLDDGFELRKLEDCLVIKDGGWISTEESTVSCPVMYFEKGVNHRVIVKRPSDKKYRLSNYVFLS